VAALAHENHVDLALALHASDELLNIVLRDCKVRGTCARCIHRVTVVEQDDGARAGIAEQPARTLPDRARHRECEQRRNRAANRKEDPLLHANAALIRPDDHFQQMHRAPFHDLETALVEEVDDDRNRKRRSACDESGIEKRHRASLLLRYAASALE
jgi:small nuclear ribonucleoprotein (snRNP)-like protein